MIAVVYRIGAVGRRSQGAGEDLGALPGRSTAVGGVRSAWIGGTQAPAW